MENYTAEIIEDILTLIWKAMIIAFPILMVFYFHQSNSWFWFLLVLLGSGFRLNEQVKED